MIPEPSDGGSRTEPPPPGTRWTVLRLVRWSTGYLAGKGASDPRLHVEHLLAHALGTDRLQLYLQYDRPVTEEELRGFKPLLLARAKRMPLQYILGRSAFRELELVTDSRVLIPRPETEELVSAVLAEVDARGGEELEALDVGTGSGAIALSLALEGPFRRVVATDLSRDALEVARENVRRAGLEGRVELREGDLLEPVERGERFHVVVSNPPYVAEEEHRELEPEVRDWEPRTALVAPEGGMRVIASLIAGAGRVLLPGGLLALEVGVEQARRVADRIGSTEGYERPVILKDLARRERIVMSRWMGTAGTTGPADPTRT